MAETLLCGTKDKTKYIEDPQVFLFSSALISGTESIIVALLVPLWLIISITSMYLTHKAGGPVFVMALVMAGLSGFVTAVTAVSKYEVFVSVTT